MRKLAIGLLAAIFAGGSSTTFAAPYVPPAGFARTAESYAGNVHAVAPDGKVAVADHNFAGGATVKVYASAADAQAGTSPIRTFSDSNFKFWGDLTFADSDTLLFSENFGRNTVYSGAIGGGAMSALAPPGSVPNAAGIALRGGDVYVVAAQGPAANDVYRLLGGSAVAVINDIGVGYAGGIAFDAAGNMLLTDTNDTDFSGDPGKLLRYDALLSALPSIDLAGGNGTHAYDVALDSEGDIFVSTESTLTRIPNGSTIAEQFGSAFTGGTFGTFVSSLDYVGGGFEPNSGGGKLWINAMDTDDASIIGITPIPEPAGGAVVAVIIAAATLRRRRLGAPIALLAVAMIASAASASQFYASEIVTRTVGAQQQPQFTDPELALGPPRGAGTAFNGFDVYCLGNGGSLTLGFDIPGSAGHIFNGPGADFIVFENTFYQSEDPQRSFAELMFVEVSSDGVNFARFAPYSSNLTPIGPFGVIDPAKVSGLAGASPVLANVDENEIDPFDPAVAGGDAFDLASLAYHSLVTSGAVDLNHIRAMRLVDVIGDGRDSDSYGRPIFDPTGAGVGGADVDSIAVINGTHMPEPAAALPLYGLAVLTCRRR